MSMRYDQAKIMDHVAAQGALVNHMTDLKQQALGVLAQTADFWTEKGQQAYSEAQRSVIVAYESVFETITRHGTAQGGAVHNTDAGDASSAARFVGI
ncbi:hypothetical protein Mycch_5542 (plasmid) [Mycolicibacterium chubuense NBB4]|uniref:Uncharacterized protein n=1 Tax=Mycolicibacterium chubuense (strain NBB4) TaxID=710421 RepID=I4BSF0_MYCCN|nr:hypothetical protein [Mycolicibacterium chubuense]AFM20207.1 hypothetical protein Mycch_5542 [Mycolicibacterium chubuense NBB4]